MQDTERSADGLLAGAYLLAPLHPAAHEACLRICLLVRTQANAANGPFVLLRELPLARVYLGALSDAQNRVQEWVEVWVQSFEVAELARSDEHQRLSNFALDQRWLAEWEVDLRTRPEAVIATGWENSHPAPLLVRPGVEGRLAITERSSWQLCRDNELLNKHELPDYDTSTSRYLYQPEAGDPRTFLAASPGSEANTHVQELTRLLEADGVLGVFNPHCGLMRVHRFSPLRLEDYLQLLEGRPWEGIGPGNERLFQEGIYSELQSWSGKPRGLPFLVHGAGTVADRMNEVFLLKAAALLGMFKEVRRYVAKLQTPLLNLSPASFSMSLPEVGDHLPALWAARCHLSRPGQGHPLAIKSTQQKYFVRLGRIEPSVFLPEGLGAHSFGTGSVRKRDVRSEADGIVFEGTLLAEDYLGLDPHDLLWFKLPVQGQERAEFYAHVYKTDALGPREARFRTVPARLDDSLVKVLSSVGAFQRAPYEIWPLLSSPCDLYSLGAIAVRILLANSQSPLPVILDDVLGLSRRLGKDLDKPDQVGARLEEVLKADQRLLDLVSPHNLVENAGSPAAARAAIHLELWWETIVWLLHLFPGTGPHSHCKDFGDVSPLALETVFDAPIDELEHLLIRLRSVLLPTATMNAELAGVILEQLGAA